MSPSTLALVTGSLAVAMALVACADADAPALTSFDGGNAPGPNDDAGDAGVDEAEPDAESRPCSADGFCHTALPESVTLSGVWGDGSGGVWAISRDGRVLRWDDASDAWKVHAVGLGPLHAIWGASPTDIWLGGDAGLLHGTGASSAEVFFTAVTAPGDAAIGIHSIWGVSPTDIWAAGGRTEPLPYASRLLHYAPDGTGTSWKLEDVPGEVAATHVWATPASGIWVAALFFNDVEQLDETSVVRRASGKTDFETVALPSDPEGGARLGRVGGVSITDASILLLGDSTFETASSWRATSTDNGVTYDWTFSRGSGVSFTMHSLLELAPNDAWAAGDYGRLRHWDGTEWKQARVSVETGPFIRPFYGMWAEASKDLWVVGEQVALRRDLSTFGGPEAAHHDHPTPLPVRF